MLEGIAVPAGLSSQASHRAPRSIPSRQVNRSANPGLANTGSVNAGSAKTGYTKTPAPCGTGVSGGSYRDRTDDIHGVNVALYQLS